MSNYPTKYPFNSYHRNRNHIQIHQIHHLGRTRLGNSPGQYICQSNTVKWTSKRIIAKIKIVHSGSRTNSQYSTRDWIQYSALPSTFSTNKLSTILELFGISIVVFHPKSMAFILEIGPISGSSYLRICRWFIFVFYIIAYFIKISVCEILFLTETRF